MFRFYKAKSGVCRSVKLDESDKSCVYLDDEYKELPKECSEYKGSVANECESILPEAYNTMCIFENNTCKSKRVSSCSDFKVGLPEEICEKLDHQR